LTGPTNLAHPFVLVDPLIYSLFGFELLNTLLFGWRGKQPCRGETPGVSRICTGLRFGFFLRVVGFPFLPVLWTFFCTPFLEFCGALASDPPHFLFPSGIWHQQFRLERKGLPGFSPGRLFVQRPPLQIPSDGDFPCVCTPVEIRPSENPLSCRFLPLFFS